MKAVEIYQLVLMEVLYIICCILYAVYYTNSVYCMLYTIYYVLYTVYYNILYMLYCILYAV